MSTVFILYGGGHDGGSVYGVYSSRAHAEQQMALWVARENQWNTVVYGSDPDALHRGYVPSYEDGQLSYDGNAGGHVCVFEWIVDTPVELSHAPDETPEAAIRAGLEDIQAGRVREITSVADLLGEREGEC